ncbi:MAG: ATP-dependent Clp protease proteolytic subunit [Phycisphaerales bacterium]|nr:ATP-dependent Clp protease proteolytic subunit [Phycisphaerales bacterium]
MTLLEDDPILVPHVIDSTGRTEREYDIVSRLLADRIVMCSGEVESEMANAIVAQLLYLAHTDSTAPASIYINGEGGSVSDGLAIIDTMRVMPYPLATYIVGSAPSMMSVIACCGTKGQRFALPHAWNLMHQGRYLDLIEGQATDLEIEARHMLRLEEQCNLLYSEATGKSVEQIGRDCDRDLWLNAPEMLAYGLIDRVIDRLPVPALCKY